MPPRRLMAFMLALFAVALPAMGSPLQLPHTDDPITIDGKLEEAAWGTAVRIDLDIETRPAENIPASVRTVAYLIEDGESLFLAFDAHDPKPGEIRAHFQDRDSAWNDDLVGVVIDTYNDERRAFEFFSNPFGIQMDSTNDDVNKNEDDLWDAIWDAAGLVNDDGYVVEIQIPLSQLRFPDTVDKQTWGIDLLRFYPRDKLYRLSNNSLDRARNCYLCQLEKIQGLEHVQPGRDLEITPTLTGSRTNSTDEPGVVPLTSEGTDVEAGVTVSWGITPDTTANLAINPDFSQVEADVAQLEVNNQFALLYPEKRPFFLEGADYFSTPIDAVFTRTVVDPDMGLKLTGKRGIHTYGTYAARDTVTNLLLPGAFGSESTVLQQVNDVFVGRYNLSFGDTFSVGALLTTRSGDEYYNHVGGFDLSWKINDQNRLLAQYLKSGTRYPEQLAAEFGQPVDSFSGNGISLEYAYDSRTWFGYVKYHGLDSGFRADAGFEPQVDYDRRILDLGYNWWGTEKDWWTSLKLNGNWDITHDDSGRMIERESEASFSLSAWLQSTFELGGVIRDTLWNGVLYRESQLSISAELQPSGGLFLHLFISHGDQVDFENSRLASELRFEPTVQWYMNRHVFLELHGAILQLDTKQGDDIFDAGVYDLRLTWQFNRNSSLRLITQLQSVHRNPDEFIAVVDAWERNLGRQLLYSYKLNPQTVFFAGYSDRLLDDDSLQRLETSDRTLFVKVGYAWTP